MQLHRLFLLTLLIPCAAMAQEYSVLMKFPSKMAQMVFWAAPPDARGYQGPQLQYDKIHDAEAQRGGPRLVMYGIVRGQANLIDDGFRVIDATFREQNRNGSIGDNKGYLETADALYLEDLLRCFQVLEESPFGAKYTGHMNQERPATLRLIHFLLQPQQQFNLYGQNKMAPNRALTVAVVFARANRFTGGAGWNNISQQFFDLAMRLYEPSSGIFNELGGGDSSYQAVNLLDLEYLYIDFHRTDVLSPFSRGLKWEMTRIEPDGAIAVAGNSRTGLDQEKSFGKPKGVNYDEVIEMFEMACVAMNPPEACGTANSIFQYRFAHP